MFEAWCKSSARSGLTIWLDELKSMKLARRLWVCGRDCVTLPPFMEYHCHIAWAVIGMFQWLAIPAVIMDLLREMPIVWLYLFWSLPLFVSLTELTCRGNCWIALVLVLSPKHKLVAYLSFGGCYLQVSTNMPSFENLYRLIIHSQNRIIELSVYSL